jgi:septal ring factor EnvC (AmiA/AmiB activator)
VPRRYIILLLGGLLLASTGCLAPKSQLSRLQETNAQLSERIRQDQVRVQNLEEQNRQLHDRLADAERAVATLHDRGQDEVIRR